LVIEVERDDILRLDLVERDPLALDPDRPGTRLAGAHVAERQVQVALECDDPARDGDLVAEAVDGAHAVTLRRSVGGYSGCAHANTMTTGSSPVLTTACQTFDGMYSAVPAAYSTMSPSICRC